ncbi:esterase family protein [Salibacterium salarium]|uniref:Esterase family protein n=1 Tax=Salibacterium salarium TaxID=284579 RepID=A0A428N8L6_9BACI|nr:alpha/beta hydrolase family protein [Salibacterium salarium]RSL34715.1 esterase family protein [Salibacterium salarium]
MALITCDFFSETLNLSTSMTVILPQETTSQMGLKNTSTGGKHQTLYLLHGFSDDHTIWTRRTSIERYVAPLGLAVVIPQVHHSFYTDMEYGGRYWTFLTEELPAVARSFFPLSEKREDNFVAGLSMGGYGALKWALRYPDHVAAAASLSGVTDIASHVNQASTETKNPVEQAFKLIFGDKNLEGTDDDLLHLLEKTDETTPSLYQCCGTEDFLYEDNKTFKDMAEQMNVNITTEFSPGEHEWGYWDKKIQDVLQWLPR